MTARWPARAPDRERGSATIEFVVVALLVVVPLTYVVLAALRVQRTAYGATEAARAAGRAFVTAPTVAAGRVRAETAARLALSDQQVRPGELHVSVRCSASPCLTPRATVTVDVDGAVELPWVPSLLGAPLASVPVHATHVETVDPFRPTQ